MKSKPVVVWLLVVLLVAWVGLFPASTAAQAQQNGQDGQDGEGQINPTAGVHVDAHGVLRLGRVLAGPGSELDARRAAAASARGRIQADGASELRKISLNRLEAAVARRLAAGEQPTEEMKHLAGLTRVKHVFFYPETKDIVIAGPAEPWEADFDGRICGSITGRPVVELQDLVVALRAFRPGSSESPEIGCSIDPTPEGLARMQQFLSSVGSYATPAQTQFIVQGLRNSLGLQTVSVHGVPANTHFARVMVEADYRMKLIGIGLEQPPVRLTSYVDLANPAQVSRNALQRWWFVPDYACVRVSDDRLAMELVGDGVKLVGEDEVVGQDGARRGTGGVSRASQAFVTSFTKVYPQLAARSPVYAQLRNLVDLAVAAAFIREQDYYRQADWKMEVFGDEDRFAVETHDTPERVETAVASIWKRNRLMTPVGGGVEIEADKALAEESLLADEQGKVKRLRESIDLSHLTADQWWWD